MIEKENHRWFYVLILFLLIVISFASCRNGDNRTGDVPAREQFEQIENNQSEITDAINKSENRVEIVEDGINEAGAIIADCQRILREVRKRNEEKAKTVNNAT